MKRLFALLIILISTCAWAAQPAKTPQTRPAKYPLEQDTSCVLSLNFNDNNGTVARDGSFSGNDGTIDGVTWQDEGWVSFDGTNDYVDCTASADFDFTTNLTLSAWVKANSISGWPRIISKFGVSPAPYSGYEMLIGSPGSDKLTFGVNIDGTFYAMFGTKVLSTNTWYYLVITYDGSVAKFYIDGEEDSCGSGNCNQVGSIITNNENLQIGRWPGDSDGYFNGSIDDVRVYNRVLSAQEISDMYEASRGRYGK